MENDPIKCVREGEGLCGGFQLQAATHPHTLSSLESISVEFKCCCRRQLSVILDMAGQGSVILSCQHWALVACSSLDAVLYSMAVYLGFMFFACFQVSQWKLCCVFFSAMLWGKEEKKELLWEGKKGRWYNFLKLRFRCPKPTYFLQCHKINLIKWASGQLVSG